MSCYDGFRLGAPSECSMRSKARIDALFEDSRSVCSSSVTLTGWAGTNVATPTTTTSPVLDDCCATDDDQRRVNSAVQARIEAMFASVEAESTTPGECAAAILPVKYMGAAPVGGRVASVRGLQEPLRQLVERISSSVNAELEVSRRGLTFRTGELHEKNNPFRRIAVWSALKLQVKRRHNNSNVVSNHSQEQLLHAFVPLVADERTAINPSTNLEDRHADLYRTMRGLGRDVDDYPPIFAVVMRRPGAARLLECHAFACRCEEDAIAAAATLYRALLADLDATSRRPRQKNGLGCVSLASVASSTRETEDGAGRRTWAEFRGPRNVEVISESVSPPVPAHQPVRPPRVKKNSLSSSANTEDEQSSSTLRPSGVNVIDKAPRRKKKVSEVKAEDVLEARSRRLSMTNGTESNAITKSNENNSSSSSSNLEQTNEERRMNAKNKIYGTRVAAQTQQASSDDVQVIEKIYEGRTIGGKHRAFDSAGSCNENGDKSSSERERSGSYDFECCTENSLYESSRIYAKARANGKASTKPITRLQLNNSQQRMYEVTRNSTSTTASSTGRRDTYSTRPPVPAPVELTYAGQRRRSIASSIASNASNNNNTNNNSSNTARRRSEHFRDADKIYSIGPEETGQRSTRGGEDKIYDSGRLNRLAPTMRSNHSEQSGRSGGKRLSRVSTMDRPLRRPSIDATVVHQIPTPQQLQQQQQLQQRRRSRAGSEPPTSHTQAAVNAGSGLMKRSQSDLDIERGDLMTRVELPRRGSFLKPAGSVRKRDGLEGGGAGTPLGFTELFDEFRNQEGLESVDDILAAIIDPEGMSFNDLKPLYKEFLLKLAATLTQDELYQRSASIMRRRRRPQRRRSSRSAGRPCLLRRAIKRSVSRLRSANSAPTEFTSVLFPARRLNDRSSFASSSSGDGKNGIQSAVGHHHRGSRVLASKLGRRRSNARASSGKSRLGHNTTSEDSDTCRRVGRNMIAATANRSSSGYVSCSECSYDSESCTCVSADKCYCSLSRKSPPADTVVPPPIVCSCDTDSCSESNKCYCARKPVMPPPGQHTSILEQLRQKGIVPSESTLSRNGSPERNKSFRPSKSLASSKSLEYLKVRSSSIRGSTDNLALDYDLFTPGGRRSSQCSSSASEKVLVVSARDPQGRLIYVGGGDGKHHEAASRHCNQGSRHRRHVVTASSGHHEALSIKKSAEIAAVFGGHNGHPRISRRASSTSSLRSSVSLEAGLGYLP